LKKLALPSEPKYDFLTLPNGIRLVHRQVAHTQIAHCGVILDVGSRDERPDQQGLAHFWEHMAFKGTTHRRAFHVLNRLEVVGGELNAFTTKEKICFYAAVPAFHFKKAFELLVDITFHSTFPEREMERERNVILEEIAMYDDTPSDLLYEELDSLAYGKHPLGHPILGPSEQVKAYSRKDLVQFIADNLASNRLIFSVVSPWSFKQVAQEAERLLSDIDLPERTVQRQAPSFLNPSAQTREKNITQAHFALAAPAFGMHEEEKYAFSLLTNVLGGAGMNARLNLSLRERQGLVYSVDAGYTTYTDAGFFSLGFACEPSRVKRSRKLALREMQILAEKNMGIRQLREAKQQYIGQMLMAEESNASYMLMAGRAFLDYGYIPSLAEVIERIDSLTAEEVRDVAERVFGQSHIELCYLPKP